MSETKSKYVTTDAEIVGLGLTALAGAINGLSDEPQPANLVSVVQILQIVHRHPEVAGPFAAAVDAVFSELAGDHESAIALAAEVMTRTIDLLEAEHTAQEAT